MTSENEQMTQESTPTFEAALARLEVIVRSLEGGTAALDESLALFEEGVALVRTCNAALDSAQQRITVVTQEGGMLTEQPFTADSVSETK